MELGYLLTRSGFTYPEVSSKVYNDYFGQMGRLKLAILPLDSPCSGPVTHSLEILTTGKSHGKKPDRFSLNDSIYMKMRMLHWWNDTDRGKPKLCGVKPASCQFVHPEVTWTDRRSNPSLSDEKPATEMDLRYIYSVCNSQKTHSVAIRKKSASSV